MSQPGRDLADAGVDLVVAQVLVLGQGEAAEKTRDSRQVSILRGPNICIELGMSDRGGGGTPVGRGKLAEW